MFVNVVVEVVHTLSHADNWKFAVFVGSRADSTKLFSSQGLDEYPGGPYGGQTHIFEHLVQRPSSAITISESEQASIRGFQVLRGAEGG